MSAQQLGTAAMRAMTDDKVFASAFRPIDSWTHWMAVLRVLFGLPLGDDYLSLFERCTGRSKGFAGPISEAWLLCGRRSGKSRILALIAVLLACFKDYTVRAPGERIVVMVLAVDRDQATVIFNYARALITETPMLSMLLESETAESLELGNGVSIEVHASSYRSVRGRTLAAALCDEIAFWRSDESRNPGTAVLAALRPSLATIPDSLLICASSMYDRSGPAYDAFTKHYKHNDSNVLVWKADTKTMNPTFRQSVIDEAYALDPVSAAAEYGSEFRSDIAAAFPDDVIDLNVCRDRRALSPDIGRNYVAFVDSSGGQHDSMAMGIGHREKDRVVLDRLVVARAPFEPTAVTADFAQVLSAYRVTSVVGDRYGSQWVVSAFAKHGITYRASELDKSAIYRELTPLLSAGIAELLDDSRLLLELRQLERRPGKSGRGDAIDHRPGGRDDVANAAAGASWAHRSTGGINRSTSRCSTPVPCTATAWTTTPGTAVSGRRSQPYRCGMTRQELEHRRAKDIEAKREALLRELWEVGHRIGLPTAEGQQARNNRIAALQADLAALPPKPSRDIGMAAGSVRIGTLLGDPGGLPPVEPEVDPDYDHPHIREYGSRIK